MKYLSTIIFHTSLIAAFLVGSIAYWGALGMVALFIWAVALLYTVLYRLSKATVAFFQVLLTNPAKNSKSAKSASW